MVQIVASLALALVLAGSPVSAAPAQRDDAVITIPVSKGTSGNPVTAEDLVNKGHGRIGGFNGKHSFNGKAINKDVSYIARVSFCHQAFELVVDTGSSNTWVRIMSLRLSFEPR